MAKHKLGRVSKLPASNNPPPGQPYPAVSVIIPLYNAEKYIGECLESILAQTFQNFEVIVVDDCSTDASPAIVESYKEKFGGRLKLAHMKKNSGCGGEPRNKAIDFSRGEYIYFMDADDVLARTALAEMYALAKEYEADVLHCKIPFYSAEEFYRVKELNESVKHTAWSPANENFGKEPVLLTEDLGQRAVEFSHRWLAWNVWLQMIRRDFITENRLRFVDSYGEDMLFIICEICSAKRYVVVPNVVYYYRQHNEALTKRQLDFPKRLHRLIRALKCGMSYLDEYLSGIETFSRRPDLRYVMFDMFIQQMLGGFKEIYEAIPAPDLDELLRKELGGGDNAALTAFTFSAMNIYRLQLIQAQQRIAALENESRPVK